MNIYVAVEQNTFGGYDIQEDASENICSDKKAKFNQDIMHFIGEC